jgi:hypothetical protein
LVFVFHFSWNMSNIILHDPSHIRFHGCSLIYFVL